MDPRESDYIWWHEAVFGARPFKDTIPYGIMRAYLNWKSEVARVAKGVDDRLLRMSIAEIKERASA